MSVKVYATRWFARWAAKQGLDRVALARAAYEVRSGLYEADLGGGLLKKRVARSGQGKRGGFRALVVTNKKDLWIFVYGFSKNERSSLDSTEQEYLKKLAHHFLSLTAQALKEAERAGELTEVPCDA